MTISISCAPKSSSCLRLVYFGGRELAAERKTGHTAVQQVVADRILQRAGKITGQGDRRSTMIRFCDITDAVYVRQARIRGNCSNVNHIR